MAAATMTLSCLSGDEDFETIPLVEASPVSDEERNHWVALRRNSAPDDWSDWFDIPSGKPLKSSSNEANSNEVCRNETVDRPWVHPSVQVVQESGSQGVDVSALDHHKKRSKENDLVHGFVSQSWVHGMIVHIFSACTGGVVGGYIVGESWLLRSILSEDQLGMVQLRLALVVAGLFAGVSALAPRGNPYGEWTRAVGLSVWLFVERCCEILQDEFGTFTHQLRAAAGFDSRKPFPSSEDEDDFDFWLSIGIIAGFGYSLGYFASSWIVSWIGAVSLAWITMRQNELGDICRLQGFVIQKILEDAWIIVVNETELPARTAAVAQTLTDKVHNWFDRENSIVRFLRNTFCLVFDIGKDLLSMLCQDNDAIDMAGSAESSTQTSNESHPLQLRAQILEEETQNRPDPPTGDTKPKRRKQRGRRARRTSHRREVHSPMLNVHSAQSRPDPPT